MNYIPLKNFSDEAIFEEVAERLKRRYGERSGMEFRFGEIAFVFHEGRFQGIEERSNLKLYKSHQAGGRRHLDHGS